MQEEGSRDLKQRNLKEEAITFYTEHNVTGVLEKLLNTMFLDSPQDIYGYMSEFFHSLSNDPVVSAIEGRELLDSNGDPSLSLTLYCIVNGIKKPIHSYTHTICHNDKEGGNENRIEQTSEVCTADGVCQVHWVSPIESVNKINDVLCTVHLRDQLEVNNHITRDLDILLHPSSQTAVSRVAALSLSKLIDKPLFLSLSNSFEKDDDLKSMFSVPSPLTAVLAGGTSKLKIRGIYLMPSPTAPLSIGIQHVINMYRELGRALATKQGPAATSINGAYCITSDKAEVLMDLLRDSGATSGVELNKDVMVFIDVGGEVMYDEDKKKYEFVAGQWKTGDEVVNILVNLVSAYPGLVGFMDPLHPKDISSWQSLRDQLDSKCLIIADRTLPDLPLTKPIPSSTNESSGETIDGILIHISCAALSVCHTQTLDKCFAEATQLRELSTYVMFSTQQCYTRDSLNFDVDLAVALHCKFIKIDPPLGIISTVVLSRLKEIQGQLESLQLQGPLSALIFPCKS